MKVKGVACSYDDGTKCDSANDDGTINVIETATGRRYACDEHLEIVLSRPTVRRVLVGKARK